MFFHPKNLKSENNNPWFKPWFNILLHTQSIVCATVDSQCLEYLGYITLMVSWPQAMVSYDALKFQQKGCNNWAKYCKFRYPFLIFNLEFYHMPPNLTLKTLIKTSPSSEKGWQGYHRICTLHFYGWLDAFTFDDGDGSREGCYKIVFPNNRFVCLFICLFYSRLPFWVYFRTRGLSYLINILWNAHF